MQELFMARFMEHVSLYQRTTYSELTAGLWLSLRLQVFFLLFSSNLIYIIAWSTHHTYYLQHNPTKCLVSCNVEIDL